MKLIASFLAASFMWAASGERAAAQVPAQGGGIAPAQEERARARAEIRKRAEAARLLAEDFIPISGDTCFRCAFDSLHNRPDLFAGTVVFAIRFEPDSTVLTPTGARAADDLARLAQRSDKVSFTLVGHTDERGSPEENKALSLRRAEAVKALLLARGILAQIETQGRGEEQPYALDDRASLTDEERHRLDQRIELEWR